MGHLRCYQMAVDFYHQAQDVEIPGYLKDQLLRAASSVALNLNEGTGKFTKKDRRRFFQMALGSIRECQAIKDLNPEAFEPESKQILDHLGASVFLLIKNMQNSERPISRPDP